MIYRKYTAVLALLLILSLLLGGCGKGPTAQDPTTEELTDPTTQPEEAQGREEEGAYLLSPQQQETFDSAVCHLFKREGQALYRVQYSNCPALLTEGKLSPDYNGMAIELSGPGDESFYPSLDLGLTSDGKRSYIGTICLTENTEELPITFWRYMLLADEAQGSVTLAAMGPNEEDTDGKMQAGQYRDLPDPENYVDAFFADNLFYTPTYDQEGKILPIGQWETSSIIYGHTYPWPQQIRASYVPLTGGDYYWIYKITEKDGNVYYSDFLPYSTPEKPVQEAAPDITAPWTKGERQQLLIAQNDVEVYLAVAKDTLSNSFYTIKTKNNRENSVVCYADDLVINGNVDCGNGPTLRVQPGKFVADDTGFNIGPSDGSPELAKIETFQFSLHVEDEISGIPLIEKQTVCVDMTEAWRVPKAFEGAFQIEKASMDFLAQEQLLLETPRLKVTLICAGEYKAPLGDRLTLTLKLENLASQPQTVQIPGYVINGSFVPTYDNTEVGGNSITYITSDIYASRLGIFTNFSIETMVAVIGAEGSEDWLFPSPEYHWIPITATESGTAEPFDFGEPLWEHEGIQIGTRGYDEETGKWTLTLHNRWDRSVNVHVMEEGSQWYINNEILAGVGDNTAFTISRPTESSDNTGAAGSRTIYFRIYDFSGETLLYEGVEHITLQTN